MPREEDIVKEDLITLKGKVLLSSDKPIKDLRGNFYQFSKKGKVGIINNWAQIVLDANYDRIIVKPGQAFMAEREGKLGVVYVDQVDEVLMVNRYFDTLQPALSVDVDDIKQAEEKLTWNEESLEFEAEAGLDTSYPFPKESYLISSDSNNVYAASNSISHDYYEAVTPKAYIGSSDKKYGVFFGDTVLIPFVYDDIIDYNGVFIVEDSGKYGVLDINNNVLQPILYNNLQDAQHASTHSTMTLKNGISSKYNK